MQLFDQQGIPGIAFGKTPGSVGQRLIASAMTRPTSQLVMSLKKSVGLTVGNQGTSSSMTQTNDPDQ